jgi:hypothetical protein
MKCHGFMLVLAGCLSLSCAATTFAQVTVAQKCEAAKLKAAGKDAACRANALARTALGGTSDLAACDTKLSTTYTNLETNLGCPTPLGADTSIVTDFVDTATICVNRMAIGLFPTPCCSDQGGPCAVDTDCCGGSPNGFIRGFPYFCYTAGGTAPGVCSVLQ